MTEALVRLLRCDAEQIADLVRRRRGDRADRLAARALLMEIFTALEPVTLDPPEQPEPPEPSERPASPAIRPLVQSAQKLRHRLEGPGYRVLSPIGEVWVRSPYPVFFIQPLCALHAQQLAARCDAQFALKLALSEERIQWMEERCTGNRPGLLRPVRVPNPGQSHRLGGSELELLRKRGKSKFS